MRDGLQIKKQIRPQTNMVPLQRHPKCRARKSCKGTCSEWNQLSRNKCNSLQYLYMDFEKHIDHIDHSHLLAGFYPWILKLLTTKCLAEVPAGKLVPARPEKTSSCLPLSCLAASTQFEAMQLVKNKIKSWWNNCKISENGCSMACLASLASGQRMFEQRIGQAMTGRYSQVWHLIAKL